VEMSSVSRRTPPRHETPPDKTRPGVESIHGPPGYARKGEIARVDRSVSSAIMARECNSFVCLNLQWVSHHSRTWISGTMVRRYMREGRHRRAPSHLRRDVALECARAQPRERERERTGTLLRSCLGTRSRMQICSCSEDHHARPGALPIRRAVDRRGADEQRVRSRAIPAPSPIVSNADCSRSTRKSFRLFVSCKRYDVFDPGSCHSTVGSSPRRSSFRRAEMVSGGGGGGGDTRCR
jgi:hypothetical protein